MTLYEEFRKWIFGKVSHPDHVVAIYALSAINSLYYYHSDGILLPHLKDPTFLKALATHCEIRKDLIVEIQMGAIRQKKDNGYNLRKYSIVILTNLLVRKDFPMNPATCEVFLGPVSRLMKDEENNRLAAFRV